MVSYLHGVEADSAEAVYAPGERADGAAPLLVPDVHLLATRCKHTRVLVVVQSCEDRLQRDNNHFYQNNFHYNGRDISQQTPTDHTLPRIVLSGSSSSP